ncbi:MAG: sugar phosphate nucleotidyltransferase [Candidatus Pacebacteria bacterium]|nr:sugar phosphate nucleotidyltransferase [Candidatus Paceibacterota bacterium]
MKRITKAIFPIAGLGTRFLPESKVVSKELIPLGAKPLLHYTVEEAILSGIEDIAFITRKNQKGALEYFEEDNDLLQILKENNKEREIRKLGELKEMASKIKISSYIQKKPMGVANALFQAKDFIFKEPCAISFCDDVVKSDIPCIEQLQRMFLTCGSPIIAIKRMPPERLPNYGVVKVEKIANRFYKVKSISEKPKIEDAPSDLAIVGRMILTPDVFEYLSNSKDMMIKDRSISVALGEMAELGKAIYAYEIEGDWLECGDITSWYKSFTLMAMEDPEFGETFKNYLRNLKI